MYFCFKRSLIDSPNSIDSKKWQRGYDLGGCASTSYKKAHGGWNRVDHVIDCQSLQLLAECRCLVPLQTYRVFSSVLGTYTYTQCRDV